MVKHKIGMDYSSIISKAKTKRDLPLVGRLKKSVDIERLRGLIESFLDNPHLDEVPKEALLSSEYNYHLKDRKGESFIRNYDEFYKKYSIIEFQTLSKLGEELGKALDYSVAELKPGIRLRGMRDTSYDKYHPYFDERNYTRPSYYYKDYIEEILSSFNAEASRSALVCLRPGEFISPHFDIGPEYVTRLMIPVITSEEAVVGFLHEGVYKEYHLPADGGIYFLNSGFEHYAINMGKYPRYQVRVCLNTQDDLDGMVEYPMQRAISKEDFRDHPCLGNNDQVNQENILAKTLKEFNLDK